MSSQRQTLENSHVDPTLALSSIMASPVLGMGYSTENHSWSLEDELIFITDIVTGSGVDSGIDEEALDNWLRTMFSDPVTGSFGEWVEYFEESSNRETVELPTQSSSLLGVVDPVGVTDHSILDGLFVIEDDYLMIDEFNNAIIEESMELVNNLVGNPPAAKRVVENLPLMELSKEEFKDEVMVCAVCNDEAVEGEMVNKLPCSHCYHKDCILPWLKMRNTCPICRYELPTDNQEYESRKRKRRTTGN